LITSSLPLLEQDQKNRFNWSNPMQLTLPPTVPIKNPLTVKDGHSMEGFSKDPLRLAAQQLEASFLAEMLKSAGFGAARTAFGGGVGEEQFASFLRQSQAENMVKAGGIGLAESLYHALKERQDG
jgi:flagellar protein FlgJ